MLIESHFNGNIFIVKIFRGNSLQIGYILGNNLIALM